MVVLTSGFPFGSREEFLEDEIPTLATHFARVTLVAEDASGSARPLPANCHVVAASASRVPSRVRLLPLALRGLAEEWAAGQSARKRLYMFRSILYYLRRASAITRATDEHLVRDALPVCFYAYWMDHKALAAGDLAGLHPGSIAVTRTHGYDLYADRHPHGYLPLRRHIARRLAGIFPVSDSGTLELRRLLSPETKVMTARLGVLRNEFVAENTPPDPIARLVVSIGSLIPLKRVSLLIDALGPLTPESGVRWLHFGDGPLRDSLARQAAEHLRIPFSLAGYVEHGELRRRLRSMADHAVLVNTSASEGVPVSMMEAIAVGIPCIGTRVGGVPELIEDGVNGYLLPASPSPGEIRQAVQRFFDRPAADQAAMRGAAVATWSARYDASKNYSAFAEDLARLMRGR